MADIGSFIIPFFIAGVLVLGVIKKIDVFAEFTEGVREGLKTLLDIFPSLFCLVVTVAVFRASGAAELLTSLLSPALNAIGFPSECGTLMLLRPFSGSAAVALMEQVLRENGADSFAGRVASVILGSSETTFYTISVYFAAVKAKKTRYALPAALCGDAAGFLASAFTVRLLLG